MIIDIRTKDCCYIYLNGKTVYVDDSTDELITRSWLNSDEDIPQYDDDGMCLCGEPLDDCPEAYEHMTHGC